MLTASTIGRATTLERMTVGWNVVEAGVALISGLLAGSVALTGFGLDSGIEVASALIVLKRLQAAAHEGEPDEDRERRALRAIGVTFFLLALFLLVDGLHGLFAHDRPETSASGIVIASAALVVMPVLAQAKQRVGQRIGGTVGALVVAEAVETRLCALLSLATLGGLLAYTVAGWWWADPVAGFVVMVLALREGQEAWRGELDDD